MHRIGQYTYPTVPTGPTATGLGAIPIVGDLINGLFGMTSTCEGNCWLSHTFSAENRAACLQACASAAAAGAGQQQPGLIAGIALPELLIYGLLAWGAYKLLTD